MAFKQQTGVYRHPNPKAAEVHFGDGETSEVKDGVVELPIAIGADTGWERVDTARPAAKAAKAKPAPAADDKK